MPTLNWIGKDAVVNHHKEVPFRLLKPVDKLSVGDDSGNLLVQGDNLEALKALLPYYAGRVKCIYIDPPYNTGNEGWVYNDNVNSPEMREWLGKVVGGEERWSVFVYHAEGTRLERDPGEAGRVERTVRVREVCGSQRRKPGCQRARRCFCRLSVYNKIQDDFRIS